MPNNKDNNDMDKIRPKSSLFIKLGSGGEWEKDCITDGYLRIGFNEFKHEDLIDNKFHKVRDYYTGIKTPKQWVTNYENQLRNFYTTDESVLWITFYNQRLWWCFADYKFEGAGYDKKLRFTKNGWSCLDINGKELIVDNLSGELLKTQGFQSTICKVKAFDYLVKKINGEELEEKVIVRNDLKALISSTSKLIKKLAPKDFEILVDLIFRQTGYQRTNVIGGPQKTKDIELLSPVTGERILVQVKCSSKISQFIEYEKYFNDMEGYDKFYYVVHSPDEKLSTYLSSNNKIIIWKLEKVSELAINSGLINWILNKVG
jgi:hypothetical protein